MNDDVELISKTLEGHSAAFGQLVSKYQDRLFNTLMHVTGCREEALDVAQDTFVQAFLKLRSFKHNSAFYTWLYRIAFNVAMSRKRRRKPTLSIDQKREDQGEEPTAQENLPSQGLETDERVRAVQNALGKLGEEHRAILVLREIDGYCYETIAEMLSMPLGTVRSRLHRARMELREQLKEEWQEELD